jgi:hypothetical protein
MCWAEEVERNLWFFPQNFQDSSILGLLGGSRTEW